MHVFHMIESRRWLLLLSAIGGDGIDDARPNISPITSIRFTCFFGGSLNSLHWPGLGRTGGGDAVTRILGALQLCGAL
jgi:hypothetical protein